MSTNLIAGASLIFLAVAYSIWRRRQSDVRKLPTPDGASAIWGHDKQIYEEDVGEAYRKWHNQHGHAIQLKGAFWHPSIVSITDPAALKHILVTNIYDYHHSKIVRPRIERLLGRGLGWIEGANEHKRMRKLVSPSLAIGNIKAMTESLYDVTRNCKKIFMKEINSKEPKEINCLTWTQKATIMISGLFNFDFDLEAGNSTSAVQIIESWRSMAQAMMQPKGFKTLVTLRRFPILNYVPIAANKKHQAVKKTIEKEVGEALIRAAKTEKKEDITRPKSLLSILINAFQAGAIDQQEMLDHITMFMVGGYETTGQALAFTLWRLAANPDIQNKLREEMSAFPGDPTYDDYVLKMPYLDAVMRESLRMNPSLAYMERVAMKDDIIPLQTPIVCSDGSTINSIRVKAGQIIVLPIVSINKLETFWDDPLTFKPERWLTPLANEEKMPKTWSNQLSFSDGPRQCIGLYFALFMYKIILRELVTSVRFESIGVQIGTKSGSSTQPFVKGELEKGPYLPVKAILIDE